MGCDRELPEITAGASGLTTHRYAGNPRLLVRRKGDRPQSIRRLLCLVFTAPPAARGPRPPRHRPCRSSALCRHSPRQHRGRSHTTQVALQRGGALPVFRRQWPGRGAQRHPGRAGQVPPRVVGSSVGKRGRQAGRAGSRRGHSSLADGVSSGVTETVSRVRSSLNQRKRPGTAQTYSKYKCSRKNLGSP